MLCVVSFPKDVGNYCLRFERKKKKLMPTITKIIILNDQDNSKKSEAHLLIFISMLIKISVDSNIMPGINAANRMQKNNSKATRNIFQNLVTIMLPSLIIMK